MQKTKFFIFGQGRSGSNLLVDLINSHPDFYCERELLNRNKINKQSPFKRPFIRLFPFRYIMKQAQKHEGKNFGFKLMYHQLKDHTSLINKLFKGEWKIIHIQRQNLLNQTFSGLIAKQSHKYMRTINDKEDDNSYHIHPADVVNALNVRKRATKYEHEILDGLSYLNLVYERDLLNSKDWNKTMETVFGFLGSTTVNVSASTLKTNSRQIDERISNYAEIMHYLEQTEYAYLLENMTDT